MDLLLRSLSFMHCCAAALWLAQAVLRRQVRAQNGLSKQPFEVRERTVPVTVNLSPASAGHPVLPTPAPSETKHGPAEHHRPPQDPSGLASRIPQDLC